MDKYKIIVTPRTFGTADDKAFELLQAHNCEVIKIKTTQLEDAIVDADAVIASVEEYPEELIAKGKKLKVISRYGVGYDKVDIEAAKKNNVAVTITPGANGDSVADYAVALMLAVARSVPMMDRTMKEKNQMRPQGMEIWQKTLGVIGTGRIGQGVAKRCKGFDMKLLCYDTYQDEAFKKECGAEYVDLDTLIANSDIITIHVPLTPETKDLFSKETFLKMKDNAIIINTARGGIVNEEDLYEALVNGVIRGAGLDVTVEEPPYASKLLELDNCIITPHAGAATGEASSKMSYLAAKNVIDILERGACVNDVKG